MRKNLPAIAGLFTGITLFFLVLLISNYALMNRAESPKKIDYSKTKYTFTEYDGNHTNDPYWIRESTYLTYSQFKRFGIGPILKESSYEDKIINENKVFKILVIGDSYTWGHGSNNSHARWGDELARLLKDKYKKDIYVTTLARPGSGTITEGEWLNSKIISKYKPDLVIVGLVFNDVMPNFQEKSVCMYEKCAKDSLTGSAIYTKCLAHKYGAIGRVLKLMEKNLPFLTQQLTNLYCQESKLSRLVTFPNETTSYNNPKISPYYPYFLDGIDKIIKATKGIPLMVAPLNVTTNEPKDTLALAPAFTERGATVLAMDESIKLARAVKVQSTYYVNPDDPHPNMFMVDKWASDIVRGIEANKKVMGKIKSLPISSGGVSYPLVSSVLPARIVSQRNDSQMAQLTLTSPVGEDGFANPDLISPKQYAPCLAYQDPYTELIVNKEYIGKKVKVTLNLDKIIKYDLYLSGYDKLNKNVSAKYLSGTGNKLEFTFVVSKEKLALNLVNRDVMGCNLKDIIDFDSYSATLEIID